MSQLCCIRTGLVDYSPGRALRLAFGVGPRLNIVFRVTCADLQSVSIDTDKIIFSVGSIYLNGVSGLFVFPNRDD